MKWILGFLAVVILAVGGVLLYKKFFPPEEKVIRERLVALADAASVAPSNKPLTQLGNAGALLQFFTEDVEIDVKADLSRHLVLKGKERLQTLVMGAAQFGTRVDVTFNDIQVLEVNEGAALAEFTALAKTSTDSTPVVQILNVNLVKKSGEWLISRVKTKDAMRRVE